MAGGNNHAKQIVIGEANKLVADLQNGHAGDLEVHGRAIGLIVQMVTPLYEAEFVTVQECREVHKTTKKEGKITKLKFGPLQFEGQITTALLLNILPFACCGFLFYILGRVQNWW